MNSNAFITVETIVNAPVEKVWTCWTEPVHIMNWNNASPEWHTPHAENDLRVGGHFVSRMEARDGSMGFDFNGDYDVVDLHQRIAYTIEGGRKVDIGFFPDGDSCKVVETFEIETVNSPELQRGGWQAILDNFKHYTESV